MRLFIVLLAVGLVACPGSRRGEGMNLITPPSRELPSQRIKTVATQQIQVQLTEYEIRLPDTLPAGHQTLHIANAGKLNHNFAIEGNGVSQKLASDLTRGDSTELGIDLKPGTYVVYCPVDKHRGRGMERTITVHQ